MSVFSSLTVRDALRDPVDRSPLQALSNDAAAFTNGRSYPCLDGRPILIDDATSMFTIAEVSDLTPTTQDRAYRDTSQLKNYVRRKVLPRLTWDRDHVAREKRLAARV